MKIRFASLLLAVALPLAAQTPTPVASEVETMFYKAFYLEKGELDFAGAMSLYEQFLAKAPDHRLAAQAAKNQYRLLDQTGKAKERDAFKAKYEKLLGNAVPATAPAPGAGGEGRPARGDGERPGAGGRPDMAARVAELEKQLEKARADGNAEEVRRLEQQLERARQGGRAGGGAGGQAGGRRGGAMGALMGNKKVSEMTAEELEGLKEGIGGASRMIEMLRNNGQEEQAGKLETQLGALKKALDANKLDDAQKAIDAIREAMPRMRGRGGEGGGQGFGGNR
jgi:tetratricopeptide (TPR) repeat protein